MSLAMLISGTIGWFVLKTGQPPLNVVFWRCVFGAGALFFVCLALGLFRGLKWRTVGLAALGGVAIVLNWLLLFSSYAHASIGVASAVYNTQPFMLLGFGVLLFGERLSRVAVGWLLLSFTGLLLLTLTAPEATAVQGNFGLGILLALGAAFFWAVATVVTKKLTGTPPHLIAFIQVCVGTLMLAPLALQLPQPQEPRTWVYLGTIGLVHTGLMYVLLYSAVQKLPTSYQGVLSFIYPVVAILVDVVLLHHPLRPLQVLGAACILVAAAGTNLGWGRRRGG